jgi:hypothetical protein
MTNAQRLYNQTCRHLQANEELALLTGRLQRLAFRAAPAPTEEERAKFNSQH